MSKSIVHAILLSASLFAVGSVSSAIAQDTTVESQVEKAHTQAEHDAVAKRFEDEAAAFDKQSAEHEKLAARYRRQPNPWGTKSGPSTAGLAKHCDRLAKTLKQSASEAREMARLHRDVGTLVGK